MGCDIHLHVEKQDVATSEWLDTGMTYGTRSYRLFSVLANVRNGRGFAGIQPIAMPQGLPNDTSPTVRKEADYYGEDGHSHSWLFVSDLLRYDWDQSSVGRGFTQDTDDGRFSEGGRAAWVAHCLESFHKTPAGVQIWTYPIDDGVPIEWRVPVWSEMPGDWFPFVLRLARLTNGDSMSVRLVFWFDN
jgi:hypothetical protein